MCNKPVLYKNSHITVFVLQIIALATMLIDHVAELFCDNNVLMRGIGRFAFVIFAFIMVEGYFYNRNDNKKIIGHMSKLLCLAVIAEICFDIMLFGFDYAQYFSKQNVIWTLLAGYICICLFDKLVYSFTALIPAVLLCFLAEVFCTDYGTMGICLMLAFYFYKKYSNNNVWLASYEGRGNSYFCIMAGFVIIYSIVCFSSFSIRLIVEAVSYLFIASLLAAYNGKKGYSSGWYKPLYEFFYPIHQLILGVIVMKIR